MREWLDMHPEVIVTDSLFRFDPESAYGATALDYDYACRVHLCAAAARAIELAGIGRGMRVLDAACGTGAATIPAAARVGAGGRVVAVDFSPEMLALATEKASRRSLLNIDWRLEDMTTLDLPDEHFDAVLCVLGIFNVPDMARQVKLFWRALRPGGCLVLVSFGAELLAPLYDLVLGAARATQRELGALQPWLRAHTPDQLRAVLGAAGIHDASITVETTTSPLPNPADRWRIVRGAGLSQPIERLPPDEVAHIRDATNRAILDRDVDSLTTSFLFTLARKVTAVER